MKYRCLIIIVEGQTEEEFIKESFAPWLLGHDIFDVRPIPIRTSQRQKGGNINYRKFKNDVIRFLKSENEVLVTSLIDFFRLPTDFPEFKNAQKLNGSERQVEYLENALSDDIGEARFLPYIQMHEFEALLFTDLRGFVQLPGISPRQRLAFEKILQDYPNPELINNDPETAPSKRLEKIYPAYKKVLHGNYILLENSLSAVFEKCPRFSKWAHHLVLTMKGEPNGPA